MDGFGWVALAAFGVAVWGWRTEWVAHRTTALRLGDARADAARKAREVGRLTESVAWRDDSLACEAARVARWRERALRAEADAREARRETARVRGVRRVTRPTIPPK